MLVEQSARRATDCWLSPRACRSSRKSTDGGDTVVAIAVMQPNLKHAGPHPEVSPAKGTNSHMRPSDVFRQRVVEARKRRGWSQAELAELLGVSRSSVTTFENGTRGVSLDDALSYCAALGLTLHT